MTNPFALTLAAILMTFRGDVPLETWAPLFVDIANNIATSIAGIFAGIFI